MTPTRKDALETNLDHLKREVRKVPDGHDMDDNSYDLGWNAAVNKCSEYYGTAMTLKAAWEKRAYEAEQALSAPEVGK